MGKRRVSRAVLPVVVLLAAACSPGGRAGENAVLGHLQEYLRIDTTNPTGNEARGAEFFARIFEEAGIPYEVVESAPGRSNIWARLDGGPEPGLVLLHHMDVVPADREYWSTDPLSGEVRDGYVWGRGAQDTKALGIVHLEAFLALKRDGRPLDRPVTFMATADEEAGGFQGAGWLVEHRPELFEGVGLLLNEGGGGTETGGRPVFEVEVTQKVPFWIRLTALDTPGHGSTPRVTSSVTRLIAALERLRTHVFEPRVIPAVEAYFRGRADAGIGPFADRLVDPVAAVAEAGFPDRLQAENAYLAALVRNTCTITRLEGSSKINVVPPEARAEIDCRLLPDQDPDAFTRELVTILDDPGIELDTIMVFSPAVSSPDSELYRAIETVTLSHFPNAAVLPSVQSGFTDSHFTRDLGITSYGYAPFLTAAADASGVHGNDERITVENVLRGVRMMTEVVQMVVY